VDGKGHDNDKKEGGREEEFPEVHNCFMIYGGQAANASAWHRKQERREVCLVKVAAPVCNTHFLRKSKKRNLNPLYICALSIFIIS
jgi:hypothetical protein